MLRYDSDSEDDGEWIAPWNIKAEDACIPVATKKHIEGACVALDVSDASQADVLADAFGVPIDSEEIMKTIRAKKKETPAPTKEHSAAVTKEVTAAFGDASIIAYSVNCILDNVMRTVARTPCET